MKVKWGTRKLFIVQNAMGYKNDCLGRFDNDMNYPYTLFMALMDRLKETATASSGFWHNRSIILRMAHCLSIVLDDDSGTIVAFYIIKEETGEIVFFQVFEEGKGLGKFLVEREKMLHLDTPLFVTNVVKENMLFWQRVGIPLKK